MRALREDGFRLRAGRTLDARQIYPESSALAGLTVHLDSAPDMANEAKDDRQTQARVLGTLLGSEEWLEHMAADGFVHALTGVAYFEQHLRRIACVPGFNRQGASARHGLACVHREIHQHLKHLAAVGLHGPQVRGEACADVDVVAENPSQHAVRFEDQAIEIQGARPCNVLAAERKQLLGKLGALLAGAADLRKPLMEGVAGLCLVQHPIGVAIDDGEQVVEVVSDPTGQATKAFHFLGLDELLLQPLTVGDVEERDNHPRPVLERRIHDGHDHIHQPLFAFQRPHRKFGLKRGTVLRQRGDLLAKNLEGLFIENPAETSQQFLPRRSPVEAAGSAIHVKNAHEANALLRRLAVAGEVAPDVRNARGSQGIEIALDLGEVLFPHGKRRIFEERPVAFFVRPKLFLGVPQRGFGQLARCDIEFAPLHPNLPAGVVQDGRPGSHGPLHATVFGNEAVLLFVKGFALKQRIPEGQHTGLVFRMNPADEVGLLDLLHRVPGQGLDGRVDEYQPPVHVVSQHHFGEIFRDQAKDVGRRSGFVIRQT